MVGTSRTPVRKGASHRSVPHRDPLLSEPTGEKATPGGQDAPRGPAADRNGSDRTIYVAVVHGWMEVHLVVAAGTRQELIDQLAGHLAEKVEVQLWEEKAQHFESLRSQGRVEEAVELYFSEVGDRWDSAFLSIHRVRE